LIRTPLFTLMLLWTGVGAGGGGGLPTKAPDDVGMSRSRLAAIDRVMQRGIRAGGFPGGAVIVGRRGAQVLEKGYGTLGWTDRSRVVANSTIYDLASLTKVIATTTALMVLFDDRRIDLDAPVSTYVPAFSGGAKDDITLRLLLEHRSGLPAYRELWRAATPADARAAVIATPLACMPGTCGVYSDVGADLMGIIVEAVSGEPLDRFVQRRVFDPLEMSATSFRPHWTLRHRIAPTELHAPRGYALRGEVHDENAWTMGGVAGHAGLFGTAGDLAVFAQMLLNGGEFNGVRVIADSTVRLFTARTPATGTRALGWDTCGEDSACGKYLSERAFGHHGFTGTSLWIDPDRELFIVLLTNRVHAPRARRPSRVITDIREDVADIVALAVLDYGATPAMPAAFRADRASGWNRPVRSARSRPRVATTPAKPAATRP